MVEEGGLCKEKIMDSNPLKHNRRESDKILAEVLASPEIKRRKAIGRFGIIVITIAITLLLAGLAQSLLHVFQWDPLGEYPLQIVMNKQEIVDGTSYPTIGLDDTLIVNGIKCADGRIKVKGIVTWVTDEPPGSEAAGGTNTGIRGPGCVNQTYRVSVPDEIVEQVKIFESEGIKSSIWHLTGTETPVKADGSEGESRTWITTSFRIRLGD